MSGFIGTAWIEIKADLEKFSKDVSSKLDSLSKSMVSSGKTLTKGLTTPIVGFFGVALNEAFDAQKVAGQTAQTLKSTGNAAVISTSQIDAMSDSIGKMVVQDNDAVKATANLVLNMVDFNKFGANADETLAAITETSYNYAAATGTSAESAAKLFTTLANDPQKALPRLVKLGVITKDQAEKYKEQIDAGKGVAVSQELLAKAQDRYAKAAKKAAGPLDKLKVSFGDIAEQIGTILLPVAEQIVDWLSKAAEAFQNLSPGAKKVITIVLGLAAALGPLLIVGGKIAGGLGKIIETGPKLVSAFSAVKSAISSVFSLIAANPIILVIIAIAALAFIIIKNWDTIKKWLLAAWDVLKKAWAVVWNAIKSVFQAVIGGITGYFKLQVAIWKAIFTGIKDFAVKVWNGIKDVAQGIWDAIVRGFKTAVNMAIDGLNLIIKAVNLIPGVDIALIPELKLAKGGIVTSPTIAMVGEAGPEAVIPLSQMNNLMGGGTLRIVDWRRGLATLQSELDHNSLLRGE